jgi:hypothetical protein
VDVGTRNFEFLYYFLPLTAYEVALKQYENT